jgi:beta-phosphoglucomutase
LTDQAVIFDLDGVLIDTYRAHYESWRDAARRRGIELTEDGFARTFGRTSREIIRGIWQVPDLDEAAVQAFDDEKEKCYREIVARHMPVMPGAVELIDALREAGFRIAVGSSAPPENVDLALRSLGPDRFDAVVNGRDVTKGKPDPEVFLLAAMRVGVEPSRSVVVEDAAPGVQAARRAGMAAVAFVSTGRSETDFDSDHPDLIVRSMAELSPRCLWSLIDGRRPSA